MEQGEKLLDQVQDLIGRAQGILSAAEARGEHRTALMAIRETRGVLELLGRITGELNPPPAESERAPLFNLPPGTQVKITVDSRPPIEAQAERMSG